MKSLSHKLCFIATSCETSTFDKLLLDSKCTFSTSKCHNLSPRLVTKARACKGVGQEWSLGITFHAPGSVGGREGMNSHIPKWVPNLGIRVLMEFLENNFKGQNSLNWKVPYTIGRFLEHRYWNGFTRSILVFKNTSMAERRVESQNASLTPNH